MRCTPFINCSTEWWSISDYQVKWTPQHKCLRLSVQWLYRLSHHHKNTKTYQREQGIDPMTSCSQNITDNKQGTKFHMTGALRNNHS
jgi:hypothetical protein